MVLGRERAGIELVETRILVAVRPRLRAAIDGGCEIEKMKSRSSQPLVSGPPLTLRYPNGTAPSSPWRES